MNIVVLGAGAWGTALAIAFARQQGNTGTVTLWAHEPALAALLQGARVNGLFLPGIAFPENLIVTGDFAAATQGVAQSAGEIDGLAVVAAPLAELRRTLRLLRQTAPELPYLWVCKGLEADSGLLPHQVAAEEMAPDTFCGALTGPSFAEEVASGLPAAVTLAAADAGFARVMAQSLSGPQLRIYANDDLIGAEVGGAVKNVLAIATGICDGLGLGLNARAALITRGLAEITRFGMALGARRETFMGLSGMGDLILTCTGDLSRNRRVGLALATGKPLDVITRELGHVAEGVHSAREVARRAASLGVDMPITQAVRAVLDGRLDVKAAVAQLMARDTKDE